MAIWNKLFFFFLFKLERYYQAEIYDLSLRSSLCLNLKSHHWICTEAAQEALKAVQNANGFIPNLIGVLANAPTALETYRTVGGINGRNSLTATEREVVQITAAVVNGCGFCVAGHTKIALKVLKLEEELVNQIRATARIESDKKLDTLSAFHPCRYFAKSKINWSTA